MMCDDHEITDDWYLNLQWCNNVLGSPLGHRVLLNGLIAFALFQAWGNTPDQFMDGNPGALLLQQVVQWRPEKELNLLPPTQAEIGKELARVLCLPGHQPNDDAIKQLRKERGFHNLHKAGQTLDFHFAVDGPQYKVLVLDTRNWRAFPSSIVDEGAINGEDDNIEDGITSAALLNKTGIEAQIRKQRAATGAGKEIIFVVSPAPVMAVEYVFRTRRMLQLLPNWLSWWGEEGNDYEDWETIDEVVRELLANLADFGKIEDERWQTHIAFLSGDIHFGYTTRVRYERIAYPNGDGRQADVIFTQLNASAFHNESTTTTLVQWVGSQPGFGQPTPLAAEYYGAHKMRRVTQHIVATPVDPAASDPQSPPPADNAKAAMGQTYALAEKQRPAIPEEDEVDPIDQVVGINNFGEVTFSTAGNQRTLVHTLHWTQSKSAYHVPLTIESIESYSSLWG
jgi:hypothetical protein